VIGPRLSSQQPVLMYYVMYTLGTPWNLKRQTTHVAVRHAPPCFASNLCLSPQPFKGSHSGMSLTVLSRDRMTDSVHPQCRMTTTPTSLDEIAPEEVLVANTPLPQSSPSSSGSSTAWRTPRSSLSVEPQPAAIANASNYKQRHAVDSFEFVCIMWTVPRLR
jgi:hypothetical protein